MFDRVSLQRAVNEEIMMRPRPVMLIGLLIMCGLAVIGGCRGTGVNSSAQVSDGAPLVISDGAAKGWRAQPADGVTMALADDDGAALLAALREFWRTA